MKFLGKIIVAVIATAGTLGVMEMASEVIPVVVKKRERKPCEYCGAH